VTLIRLCSFAYLEFGSLQEASGAVEAMHQVQFNGRRLNCQYVHRPDLRVKKNPESRTLFVGNLSFNTTDADLNELFKNFAGCLDVRVATDRRTGQSRGFVHADFADVQSAAAAKKKLEGTAMYGRRLRLDFSTPPEDKQKNNERMQSNAQELTGQDFEGQSEQQEPQGQKEPQEGDTAEKL
jgi:RNA recognition motif-containing protein